MTHRSAQLVVILVIASAASAVATSARQAPRGGEFSGTHLKARASVIPATAIPGQRVTLVLDVTPGNSIHVYAPGQANYIPIALKTSVSTDFTVGTPRYPAPIAFYFEPLKETVKIYNRPFRIAQVVTLAASSVLQKRAGANGTIVVAATLEYQACDDNICYKPDAVPVRWTIALAPAGR